MIADLKPYPAYKDSGTVWLGRVPEHWKVRRLRNVTQMCASNVDKQIVEGEDSVRLCNYVDVYKNDFIKLNIPFMRATATKDEISRFRLNAGDVLITKDSEAWNDIGVPALVTESADDLVCGYHLALLRPLPTVMTGGYLLRALQSRGVQYQFHVEANGVTRYGLSHSAIKSVSLPLPSQTEQAAIVRYLNYMDRRIRRYIRAKQKLIKLLDEQKQVAIHQAVTGQVDVRTGEPYPAYNDSVVEWLGKVPEHWEVRRLRNIVDLRVSNVDKLTAEDEEPVRLCNYVDAYKNERITDRLNFMRATASTEEIVKFRLKRGDVLITKDSEMWNDIGVPALVEWSAPDLVCGYHLAMLRPRAALLESDFLLRAMQHIGVAHQLHVEANGVTRYGLSQDAIKSAWVPLPPIREQVVIAHHIDEVLRNADTAIENASRNIELLREYWMRLIADVVTGKLDVREAVANLPDEAEEHHLLNDENLIADGDQIEEIAEEEAALEEVEV